MSFNKIHIYIILCHSSFLFSFIKNNHKKDWILSELNLNSEKNKQNPTVELNNKNDNHIHDFSL